MFDPLSRYCYVQGSALSSLLADNIVLDALLHELHVPGKAADLKRLSVSEKYSAVVRQVEHLRTMPTSKWHGLSSQDALAAAIFSAEKLSERFKKDKFSAAKKEQDLFGPVCRWLQSQGCDVWGEVPMGTARTDVYGHRKAAFLGLRPATAFAVELKNDLAQLKRGIDQLVTYAAYAQYVFLAVTPHLAASAVEQHARGKGVKQWDMKVLDAKIRTLGAGLLLVEGDNVTTIFDGNLFTPDATKVKEVSDFVAGKPSWWGASG